MTVDTYAPCPCGSGKKLKFCKCVENLSDYEKLVKLIEGGQGVAAIDRINQLLSKTPNAAWLLAIKGELSLSMGETSTFRETADRFLKLKPDNPLALIMKSVVSVLEQEPVEDAARYLLNGMSEARDSMPALTLSAIRLLIRSLASSGRISMSGYWSDVLSALTGNQDGPEEDSVHIDPSVNLIAKGPARIIDDAPGAAWKERLAEVLSLARTFRYAQAETKLRSILRDFPDQPGPLSHLFRAQCAQLDQSGAVATARKLAANLELTAEDRNYYSAVALELEPEHQSLQSKMLAKYCEIDSESRVDEVLREFDFVESPEGEGVERVRQYYAAIVNDEVPAKRIYSIFDKALKSPVENEERVVASSVGTVVVYGKQTDKPARVLWIANELPAYEGLIAKVTSALELGAEVEGQEVPANSVYVEFLSRPKAIVGKPTEQLNIAERGNELLEDFLNMPLALLGWQSPMQAATDEKQRAALLGLLYHLEGEQSIVVEASAIDEIYQRLELTRPVLEVDPAGDSLRLATVLDMDRVDITKISDRQLKGLMVRAMGMGATRVFYRCALAVREREGMADDAQLQVAALSGLLSVITDINEQIEICVKLEETLSAAKAPVGKVIIQHMSLLHAAGRPEEAQQVLLQGAQKHPDDPYLMSFIQYAMQSQGQMQGGPGGGLGEDLAAKMMQNASRQATAETESGLVLPGQDSTPSGESKLWLPGS